MKSSNIFFLVYFSFTYIESLSIRYLDCFETHILGSALTLVEIVFFSMSGIVDRKGLYQIASIINFLFWICLDKSYMHITYCCYKPLESIQKIACTCILPIAATSCWSLSKKLHAAVL